MSSTVMEQQSPRETIRARLLAERKRIFAEIEAYPAPITACDAQFNHLLEQRARIAEELARLEALPGDEPKEDTALSEFLRKSAFIDSETVQRLLGRTA